MDNFQKVFNFYRTNLLLFLTIFFSLQRMAQAGSTSVAESLYKNKSSLETIFKILDKDNSGYISLDEFDEACELLRQHFPYETHEQLMEMCRMMDINKDGLVDLNEFLEAFRLCESTKESLVTSALAKEPPKVDPKLKITKKETSIDKQTEEKTHADNHVGNGSTAKMAPEARTESYEEPNAKSELDEKDADVEETEQVSSASNKTLQWQTLAIDSNGQVIDGTFEENQTNSLSAKNVCI